MDILAVILLLIVLYYLKTIKDTLVEKTDVLEGRISLLQRELKPGAPSAQQPATIETTGPVRSPETAVPEDSRPPRPPETPVERPETSAHPVPEKRPEIQRVPEAIAPAHQIHPPAPRTLTRPPEPVKQQPSFFERYPDLEKFIGENVANKIGIAILVLSVAYFVKYAIDNNWIGPAGRVAIGVLAGGILIGLAHRIRTAYKAFSSVLVGGGLAMLYFTITLAYQQFHLFSQTVAFVILVVITAFAVTLSLLYDREELAVIALAGGFGSPFMVSGDHANYHTLFVYLLVLNAGLLAIAYNRSWRILNIVSFVLTVLVFAGVILTISGSAFQIAFIYGTVFYLMYFAVNVAYNIREQRRFIASDFGILLSNTALYFAAGLYLLFEMGYGQFSGLFTALLGVINLVLSYVLLRNKKVDSNILFLLIGITLTFVSLIAPVQLHGNNITIFWASEAVLLYWLFIRSDIKLTKLAAQLVWLAMIVSLLMDWLNLYSHARGVMTVIVNRGFVTTVFAAVASWLLSVFAGKEKDGSSGYGIVLPVQAIRVVSLLLLFMAGFLELNHQFTWRYPGSGLHIVYLMLYTPAFVFVLSILSGRYPATGIGRDAVVILLVLTTLLFMLGVPQYYTVQAKMLETRSPALWHFAAHYAGAVFVALLFRQLIVLLQTLPERSWVSWLITAAVVVFLSFEVHLFCNILFWSESTDMYTIQQIYIKTGLPILWGLISFVIMWLGMRHKQRVLRVISLSLFSLTLVKLFLFDIRNIPAAGKIAAFFFLGVLLLIISFMYQKVKKIIIDDEPVQKDE